MMNMSVGSADASAAETYVEDASMEGPLLDHRGRQTPDLEQQLGEDAVDAIKCLRDASRALDQVIAGMSSLTISNRLKRDGYDPTRVVSRLTRRRAAITVMADDLGWDLFQQKYLS